MNYAASIRFPSCNNTAIFRRAFSLIEVTMAIGLISFSLLTILGLLPTGLSTLRQAMNQTGEGQILQKLNGKIMLTPFSKLPDQYAGKTFYYDEEGGESSSQNAFYTAKTFLINALYPGLTNAPGSVTPDIQLVRIDITRATGKETNRFNLLVANSGN